MHPLQAAFGLRLKIAPDILNSEAEIIGRSNYREPDTLELKCLFFDGRGTSRKSRLASGSIDG